MIRTIKADTKELIPADDGLLAEVREVIGDAAYGLLLSELGGKRLYVPKSAGQHTVITAAIGAEASAALSQRFGGESLTLPASARKQGLILGDVAAGMTTIDVARKYYISDRYVRYLKARTVQADDQMRLL
ncbi:hypothetical protein [Asticcacaulis sp. YBE204]|uniref:hypothetical protein n=1 Tax=Asticcacaulis sp. YBE204 TaxID=1282363 RepID=UPI0003C412FC|nr:hypothetical protein [Asticcacaulis sp. YBE204]ESQ78491.1 hypothetical protein AEYBE204_13130 [Asticcacaulis sp. YBE204]